jgi:hypothetical protein
MSPNSHFLRTLVVGVPLLLGVLEARAQTPDSIEIREMLRRAQNRNWYVRVQHDDDTVLGNVRFVRDTVVIIDKVSVPLRSFQSVERRTRQGSAVPKFALAGGLVVAWYGYRFSGALCESATGCAQEGLLASATGFMLGGALGTTIGLVVDPGSHVWISVWPEK